MGTAGRQWGPAAPRRSGTMMTVANQRAPCKWGTVSRTAAPVPPACSSDKLRPCLPASLRTKRPGVGGNPFTSPRENRKKGRRRGMGKEEKNTWQRKHSLPGRRLTEGVELEGAFAGHASTYHWCWVRNRYPKIPFQWASLRNHGGNRAHMPTASTGK